MDRQNIIKIAREFVESSDANYIAKDKALSKESVGLKIFEAPIFAFGAADDEYFKLLKNSSAIGEHFMLPNEWLPQAKTVISFFPPFSEAVRKGNSKDLTWPSEHWLHGRIEGQELLNKLCRYLEAELINAGYNSLVPSLDKRFWSRTGFNAGSQNPDKNKDSSLIYTSNWSERHAGFVCGLGTFGLSKGLITAKGIAGRFGSIITELFLPPDKRSYKDIYEYCSMCGACVTNCPAEAISLAEGKKHKECSAFLDKTEEIFKPRFGCGKCQVSVPCETCIPGR